MVVKREWIWSGRRVIRGKLGGRLEEQIRAGGGVGGAEGGGGHRGLSYLLRVKSSTLLKLPCGGGGLGVEGLRGSRIFCWF